MKQRSQATGNSGSQEYSTVMPFPASSTVQALEPSPERVEGGPVQALEKMKESLIFAFLAANLDIRNLPLKAFLDNFEKNILLACLRLTHGNQRHAAAMLSLKPTALFEKMRKYGIRSQRGRLDGEHWDLLAGSNNN